MAPNKPSLDQLRELVGRARRENPHLTTRLEKAAFLLLLRPIVSLGDQRFQVGSEDGLRYYEIINGHCQCHDYLRHGSGHPCKHRLALAFHQRLECSELSFPSLEPKSPSDILLEMASNPGRRQEQSAEPVDYLDTVQE
ncbi:MAG: SWIM zinc finger family protein [Chloroflexi bacterium]|nr:SWIM zinc finger family protein [Chloroflexota bacterium]